LPYRPIFPMQTAASILKSRSEWSPPLDPQSLLRSLTVHTPKAPIFLCGQDQSGASCLPTAFFVPSYGARSFFLEVFRLFRPFHAIPMFFCPIFLTTQAPYFTFHFHLFLFCSILPPVSVGVPISRDGLSRFLSLCTADSRWLQPAASPAATIPSGPFFTSRDSPLTLFSSRSLAYGFLTNLSVRRIPRSVLPIVSLPVHALSPHSPPRLVRLDIGHF